MKLKSDMINKALEDVKTAQELLKVEIERVQDSCDHSDIAECEYVPSDWYSDAKAPERICLSCGLAEEGWGCGYKVLIERSGLTPRGIPRDVFYKIRQGKWIKQ